MLAGKLLTPGAVSVVQRHAVVPASGNNYFSSPAAEVTGDYTVVAQITMTDYTPASSQYLCGQAENIADNNFFVLFTSGGVMKGVISDDGVNELGVDASAATGFTDATEHTIRWRFDIDNGSSQRAMYSDEWNGSSWSAIGTSPVNVSGAVASVQNSAALIMVGGIFVGANRGGSWAGNVKRIQVFSGLVSNGTPFGGTGTMLWDFNPNDYSGSGTTWVSKSTGETWTIVGTASVVAD